MNATIKIEQTPEMEVAFITHIGEKGLANSFNKLMAWARPLGLMDHPDLKMATIYHDSFKITEASKVRMSACIILNSPVKAVGEIGLTSIRSGKHIVARYEIRPEEFEKAWSGLFVWMNENGYQKRDRDPFEIYHNDFNQDPQRKCIVDFYIPVE